MLPAVVISGKFVAAGALAVAGVVAMIIYLPGAIAREVTQSEDTPLPEWMGTVRARRARLRVIFGILGIVAIAAVGAIWATDEPAKTALVVVDNDSDEPLALRAGGSDVLTVAPRSRARWPCAPGRARIAFVRGETSVFDEEVELADHGKYVANPDATRHYAIWTLDYGRPLGFHALANSEFGKLQEEARRIRLIEPAPWHEVTADYVLEAPPKSIRIGAGSWSASRTVVAGLPVASFDVLRTAQTKRAGEPVNDKFVEQLRDVLASVPAGAAGSEGDRGR